jgi:hypothetical protein
MCTDISGQLAQSSSGQMMMMMMMMMMTTMMKMTTMAVHSTKTLLHILHTILVSIPEHNNIQKHGHKNLKNITLATVKCPYSNPKIIPEKY